MQPTLSADAQRLGEEIARQAGGGIGTLYRHFPTREHLVEVVYRRELELRATAAAELMPEKAPDIALEEWMLRFVRFTSNTGLFREGTTTMYFTRRSASTRSRAHSIGGNARTGLFA
ncbi:helix-turn-helix transcriptional regulator [Aliirhizobium smilacinae]|uniref:Helix-turn-helix transcriptional regulator n=2 Tax=Aliirhizobium smilacinae TaxID=1395944 RepID=A0A5C4XFU6_9HYPH|nr:helix-turn-helix transcriptional regulator [Rhizobium smilacinae]